MKNLKKWITMDSDRLKPYFLAACSATLLYLSSGALTGWTAPALPRLRDAAPGAGGAALSPAQQSWVAALAHLAHAVVALPAAALADRVGRHVALALSAAPFVAAWVLTALAGQLAQAPPAGPPAAATPTPTPSPAQHQEAWPVVLPLLLAARCVGGAGAGAAYTVGAMYLGEVAPDGVRGAVGTLFQLALNAGVMLEYCLGPQLPYVWLAGASAVAPVLFLAAFAAAPESPYYLLMKGQRAEAQAALARLRGAQRRPHDAAVEAELRQMERTVEATRRDGAGLRALLAAPCNQRALCVCVGLYTTALLSGHVVVLSYATLIFQLSRSGLDPDASVVALGAVQIATSVVSSLLVDVAGRRPLLVASCAGCALSLAAEGAYFYLEAREGLFWVPLAALVVFLVAFTLGLGSVPGAILGELFPTNVKAVATAVVSMYHALMSFLVVKLMVAVEYELHLMFWTFSAFSAAGTFFVWFLVPETKGKTLLEVHYELQNGFVLKDLGTEKDSLIKSGRKSGEAVKR